MKVYFDFRDWWIGYYRGDTHHYICPLPTLVIRWPRSGRVLQQPYKDPFRNHFANLKILEDSRVPENTAYVIPDHLISNYKFLDMLLNPQKYSPTDGKYTIRDRKDELS